MVARNRLISLIYRIIAFGVSVFSLVVNVSRPEGGASAFLYFTILSGLFIAILLGAMIIANLIDLIRHGINGIPAGIYMPIAMAGNVYITITAIIGNIVFPCVTSSGVDMNAMLCHLIVPVLYVLDWLVFEEKGTVKWWASLYWLIFPLLYGTFCYLRPFIWPDHKFESGSNYPYPFMDPNTAGGVGNVVLNIFLIALAFEGMGLLYIFLNDLLAGKFIKRVEKEK